MRSNIINSHWLKARSTKAWKVCEYWIDYKDKMLCYCCTVRSVNIGKNPTVNSIGGTLVHISLLPWTSIVAGNWHARKHFLFDTGMLGGILHYKLAKWAVCLIRKLHVWHQPSELHRKRDNFLIFGYQASRLVYQTSWRNTKYFLSILIEGLEFWLQFLKGVMCKFGLTSQISAMRLAKNLT